MISWSDCFFFYQWLTNFSRLLPIFSETLPPPLNFLFSGFSLPPMFFFSPPLRLHLLLIVLPLSPFSPTAYCPLVFFMPHIFSIFPLFYFPSFLSCLAFRHPHRRLIPATALQDFVIIKHAWTLPPSRPLLLPPVLLPPITFTFYLRLFLLYSPVFHSRSSARFFVRSFLLFSHAFQFPHLYCLIFHAFFSLWAWSSVDLAHAILKHFSTTLPCNFFTKHSTSVDASILCTIVFLRVACSWGWVTSFPVPSSFRLSPLPFCHLSFFLPLFLSLLFSRFTRPPFFLRCSRCHGNCLIFHPFLAALFSLRFVLNFSLPPYSPLSFLIFSAPLCFSGF